MKERRRYESELVIPANLSEWIDEGELREWVLAETGTFEWDHPALKEFLRTHPEFRPRELLVLLTFSYSTGIFESNDIVHECSRNAVFRELTNGYIPIAREVELFRKKNRVLITSYLVQVLKRALRQRYEVGDCIPAGIRRYLLRDASERLDIARHMDRAAQGA